MKFALNYSPQAAALLDKGRIQIDLYKCPDWPDLIAEAEKQRPVYVHFPLIAGRANTEKVGWSNIDHLLNTTDTFYINTHLAPNGNDLGIPLDTRDPAHCEQLIEIMLRDIEPLVKRYGKEKIILENAIWDVEWGIARPLLEPGLIRTMVEETGCGFLMDTAHAIASARYFGVDERDYILRLPVHQLRELHITGLKYEDSGVWVDHFAMTESDWAINEWAIEQIRAGKWAKPWVLAFEYGGIGPLFEYRSESRVIAEQVPRLYRLAKSVA